MHSPCVLLVEDEALIALALADDLEGKGYEVAGPFHRCSDGLDWLGRNTPDIAIIDIHLRDGSSAELACVLRERGIPFIVFSGEKRDGNVPEAFAGARWLSKPVSTRQLLETVGDIVPVRAPARPCALAEPALTRSRSEASARLADPRPPAS